MKFIPKYLMFYDAIVSDVVFYKSFLIVRFEDIAMELIFTFWLLLYNLAKFYYP